MKRDMDLARKILLAIEDAPYQGKAGFSVPQVDGYTSEEIDYNVLQLKDAGFIEAHSKTRIDRTVVLTIERLTWGGHEFLDAARDQKTWNQAKSVISEKGGSLTFDVLKAVLSQLARQAVGL